ncbi:MAG: response regulator [Deltaproteobacteria bacterium]|nr:response regulator [Deltaproteobacteria bacterium]MBN2672218.1 response regulator [Deltaproteobacteria bacterium]
MTTYVEHHSEPGSECPLTGLTLLLCDDEVRLRQIVVLMAEELGATVIDVDNSEEAIAVYEAQQENIDLIMLDLRMAGMSGEAAYRKIKEINPGARVALSSGICPEDEFLNELDEAGCSFIEKPFDMDGLSAVLSKLASR